MTALVNTRSNPPKTSRSSKRRAAEVRPPRSPQDLARAIFAQADRKRQTST